MLNFIPGIMSLKQNYCKTLVHWQFINDKYLRYKYIFN